MPDSASTPPVAQERVTSRWVVRGETSTRRSGQRQRHRDPPHRVEQLPAGEPARFRRAGARRHTRVDHVHVHRQEHALAFVHRDGETPRSGTRRARRETISLISNERIRCPAIQASVAGSGQ